VRLRFFPGLVQRAEVDPADPGRVAVCGEYQNMDGALVCAERSDLGWATVVEHAASEQDGYWPGDSGSSTVRQVWRELKLASATKYEAPPPVHAGWGQTVVKVSVRDDGAVAQVPYCLPHAYAKSMVALGLSGQHVQGALPLGDLPMQRVLVVGLGGGSLPVWLHHAFPAGRAVIDVLEINPAVIRVATAAMGFPQAAVRPVDDAAAAAADAIAGAGGQTLRVYPVPGEAFLEALAAAAGTEGGYRYDMVFNTACDTIGRMPPVLVDPEGPFLGALRRLLAPRATVAMNLLVGISGTGSAGGPKEVEAMTYALHGACCDCARGGRAFSVMTPVDESSGNRILVFLRSGPPEAGEAAGGDLREALRRSAEAVSADFPADSSGARLRFALARRVVFGWQDWQAPAAPPPSMRELEEAAVRAGTAPTEERAGAWPWW